MDDLIKEINNFKEKKDKEKQRRNNLKLLFKGEHTITLHSEPLNCRIFTYWTAKSHFI